MEFFHFMFSSIEHFIGFVILFWLVSSFLYKCWNRFLRHWTLLRHGYPPPHCDADGESREYDAIIGD